VQIDDTNISIGANRDGVVIPKKYYGGRDFIDIPKNLGFSRP